MLKKIATLFFHVTMLALVCAAGAYWAIKIATPPPIAAPPAMAAPAPRQADAVLAARMFGLVQAPVTALSSVQVAGVFAAGKDSAAILAVDGKPGRVVLLGQELTPGTRLVGVQPEGVTLETSGGRQEMRMPPRPPVSFGGSAPPAAGFTREGNTLTAPSAGAPTVPAPGAASLPGVPARSPQPVQQFQPTQQLPQSPQPTRSDAPFPQAPAGGQPLTQ